MEYGVNLPRAGRPHKLSDHARRWVVREATKTPMTTLKELKASAAEVGETLHATTGLFISQSFMTCYVWKRESHCWRKLIRSQLEFIQRHVGDSRRTFFGLMRPKWRFWAIRLMFVRHQTLHITQTHHPHLEAWWWQHHAVWMLLSNMPWKACKGRGLH